jgi:hypothetical protein
MYTGTLIKDLVATVERAERGVFQQQIIEETELQHVLDLQNAAMHGEPVYAGAA